MQPFYEYKTFYQSRSPHRHHISVPFQASREIAFVRKRKDNEAKRCCAYHSQQERETKTMKRMLINATQK
ncbi:MAG: hypothetical protein Q4A60_09365, partial [Pasteurellaceae bacterium]|nr:hypothetical protein [Pasteurellaceae bacterium]